MRTGASRLDSARHLPTARRGLLVLEGLRPSLVEENVPMRGWAVRGGCVAPVAICLAVTIFAGCSSGDREVQVATASGTVTGEAPVAKLLTTTTSPAVPAPSSSSATTSKATTTTKRVARSSSTTTTVPVSTTLRVTTTTQCRNSHDPACGPFYWDPEPRNDPMTVEVNILTAEPRVGQAIEFRVVATDDGRIDDCLGVMYGDDKDPFCTGASAMCPAGPRAYGPWAPPPKGTERLEKVFSHVYDKPGTYTFFVIVRALQGCQSPLSPYGSTGQTTTEVVVEP